MRARRLSTCKLFNRGAVAIAGVYDCVPPPAGPTYMPKFLRIGINQSNVSGYTSKAWCIRRVGSTVFLQWGAVTVHGAGDGRKIHWTIPPREKTLRCRTVQRAQDMDQHFACLAAPRRRMPDFRFDPSQRRVPHACYEFQMDGSLYFCLSRNIVDNIGTQDYLSGSACGPAPGTDGKRSNICLPPPPQYPTADPSPSF